MHKLTPYEVYLLDEDSKFGCVYGIKDETCPKWLEMEHETYRWIFMLSRTMGMYYNNRTISNKMIERINQIQTIRFLRYRDISPVLKKAIEVISREFISLKTDLAVPVMWKKENILSREGLSRWRKAGEVVSDCCHVIPDVEWREKWLIQQK